MEDVLMLAMLVIAVALLAAYVAFCDRVISRAHRLADDVRPDRRTDA